MYNKILLTLLFIATFSLKSFAQLYVEPAFSIDTMITDFFNGNCVQISNIQYSANPTSMGFFEGSATNVGLNAGILLTSGNANNAIGPNNTPSGGMLIGTPGDTDIDNMLGIGNFSYDAAFLEFDLVPEADSLAFKYVFGSEEYPEYVGSSFNDAFAFFISGPGINGVKNIATLADSINTVVAINNINGILFNTNLYVNNETINQDDSIPTQYDGLTVPLIAAIKVIPNETYHVKIVVSDVGDAILDSGVFLSVESLCGTDSLLANPRFEHQVNPDRVVAFTNKTKYATSVTWDFGDGATTTNERNPVHTYAQDGIYTVTLSATNYAGTQSVVQKVTVGTVGIQNPDVKENIATVQYLNNQNALQISFINNTQYNAPTYLKLFDLNGKCVLTSTTLSSNGSIKLQNLPSAMYLYQIYNADNNAVLQNGKVNILNR